MPAFSATVVDSNQRSASPFEVQGADRRQTSVNLLFRILVTILPLTAKSALPEPILPQGVGVNIHFTRGHQPDLDMIAAAGFRVVRMDFGWAGIERKKGEYDWAAYDELTGNLEKRGIQPYYILDYSNPLYEEAVVSKNAITGKEQKDLASPQRPESLATFARWAATAAKRYAGRRIIWEIWNEPNITFWKPRPNVQQYTALALATLKAIREADPNAIVAGPATSEVPLPFLEEFFKSGVLEDLDAVSVHPYRSYKKPPETVVDEYKKLRALIERYAPAKKRNMPILSGEWGYASHTKGVSVQTQANFIVRQQLANLLAGVPVSIWYDWKNDGTDSAEREHNFGTVTQNLEPKPAYIALQSMTRELAGFHIERHCATGNTNDFVLELTDGKSRKLAAWTVADAHTITLPLKGNSAERVGVCSRDGGRRLAKIEDGKLMLELSGSPSYIDIRGWRLN
jgi:hypothetical protein